MILPLKSEIEHGTLDHKAPKSLKIHPPSAVIIVALGASTCTVQVDAKTTFNSRLKSFHSTECFQFMDSFICGPE